MQQITRETKIGHDYSALVKKIAENTQKEYYRAYAHWHEHHVLIDPVVNAGLYAGVYFLPAPSSPWLLDALQALTERQRLVLTLVIDYDLTTPEIAAYLHCSVRNVQKIKQRALQRLRFFCQGGMPA